MLNVTKAGCPPQLELLSPSKAEGVVLLILHTFSKAITSIILNMIGPSYLIFELIRSSILT